MALLNLAHQIGTLCGAPISKSGATSSTEPSGSTTTAALWKLSFAFPNLIARSRSPNGESEIDSVVSPNGLVSPCHSPVLTASPSHPGLAAACNALLDGATVTEEEEAVSTTVGKGVPVYVMLPLDTVRPDGGGVKRRRAMNASLMAMKSAGVEGVMVDVWWGVVERERPGDYDWSGYAELVEMARRHGLKVQAVMSFHRCGGNVGDSCHIPLPKWVLEEMEKDPGGLSYTDQWGRKNREYVSLGCDTLPVLKGRTPVRCYADFMRSFRDQFHDLLGSTSTIVEIQVGMGPAGELRYPSYPELHGTWKFPGIGAFQCYDKYMLSSLKAAALAVGEPEWGNGGPTDAGGYNNWPEDTAFFRRHDGGWSTPYGEFFLTWYSQMLLDHGERVLSAANAVFRDEFSKGLKISVKIAGIHWHYGTRSHAAELTAGYYNTRRRDGYLPIARMLGRHGAIFNFTCLEMKDWEQPGEAQCKPEGLVTQVRLAATEAGLELAGENALPRFDESALDQIVRTAVRGRGGGDAGADVGMMCGFTYLRMSPDLFHPENWRKFVAFVKWMGEGRGRRLQQVEREAAPLVRDAATTSVSG